MRIAAYLSIFPGQIAFGLLIFPGNEEASRDEFFSTEARMSQKPEPKEAYPEMTLHEVRPLGLRVTFGWSSFACRGTLSGDLSWAHGR